MDRLAHFEQISDPGGDAEGDQDPSTAPSPDPGQWCELCGDPIPDAHSHLIAMKARTMTCSCRPCYLLFTSDGSGGRQFRAVPERYLTFPDFELSEALWEALEIPGGMGFFLLSSERNGLAAFYPGRAGARESLLSLEVWEEVVAANPSLGTIVADLEAVIVRWAQADDYPKCYLAPVDACYRLVGVMRKGWQSSDGGREARQAIEAFFDDIEARAEEA
ncbi:MAG: DUF5947 family protein [Actinomycetota bacterium]|nr:DUF5947 family protein [Actinomycetota bacterium]